MKGLVIKIAGSNIKIKADNGQYFECVIKGNFRIKGIKSTNPVIVGDRVDIEERDGGTAFISNIEERRNYIVRKPVNLSKQKHIIAANLDLALIVITLKEPVTNITFVDRFLATAEAYNVPAVLLFNKTDIYKEKETAKLKELIELYSRIGYKCIAASAITEEGIEDVKKLLTNKITLVAGNSGVGKSSIINTIDKTFKARTGEISSSHHMGIHTTTNSEMYELPSGGYIIDTPGLKGFGTIDFKEEEIGQYFPEIFKESKHCRFNNCTHTHEPGCAVLEALDKGEISQSRYRSYLNIMEDNTDNKYREEF